MVRVLCVDDQEGVRELMAELLVDAGFEVEVAACVDEALALHAVQAFDVIVTDLNLDGRTGLDLYKALRLDGDRTFVVLCTGEALPLKSHSLQEGLGYLRKPFEAHELLIAIDPLRLNPPG